MDGSKTLAQKIADALSQKKGDEVLIIDIAGFLGEIIVALLFHP